MRLVRGETKLHIAIDADDVCVDFVGGLLKIAKKEYGIEINPDDITDFNLSPWLDPVFGMPWFEFMKKRDWLWSTFDAVDGAIGTLEKLRNEGHFLEIVSHKPRWSEHSMWQFLGKWRLPVQRVTLIDPSQVKADFTDADILIDDKFENVKEFARAGRRALLFDRPHNRGITPPQGVRRVRNWQEVYEEIRRIG